MFMLTITQKFDLIISYFKDNKSSFAKKIGISNKTLDNYYGVGSKPPYTLIAKIVEVYNIDGNWLLSEKVTDATGMFGTEKKGVVSLESIEQKIESLNKKITDLETLLKNKL